MEKQRCPNIDEKKQKVAEQAATKYLLKAPWAQRHSNSYGCVEKGARPCRIPGIRVGDLGGGLLAKYESWAVGISDGKRHSKSHQKGCLKSETLAAQGLIFEFWRGFEHCCFCLVIWGWVPNLLKQIKKFRAQ